MLEKDIIKKDLRCSPDRAERWAMGIWGLRKVEDSVDIRQFAGYAAIDRGHPMQGYAPREPAVRPVQAKEVRVF